MATKKGCKDCGSTTRVLGHPGPRCFTCWNKVKKERSQRAHGQRVEKVYGISAEEYAALLAYQGGKCAICQRANGTVRRLAVDHDHETELVRGLCCKLCNTYLLGYAGMDTLERAIAYLKDPPANHVLSREA